MFLLPPLIAGFNSCDNYPDIGGTGYNGDIQLYSQSIFFIICLDVCGIHNNSSEFVAFFLVDMWVVVGALYGPEGRKIFIVYS